MSVRLLEDLTALEKLALIDISYSRLDTYITCGARYFYTYITKDERTFGPAAALGNMVHGVLEERDWTERFDLFEMHQNLAEQRERYDPDHQIDETLLNVGYQLLTEFVDRHDDEVFDVIATEMPFSIVVGSALVNGYIDRVDRTPAGGIRITDYKTGKYEVTFKDAPSNLQLGIYALAVSKMYPNVPIRADLYYLRTGRVKGHDFTPQDLAHVEERLLDVVNELIESQNFKFTQEIRPCSYCDFRKTGVCPVGVRRYPS